VTTWHSNHQADEPPITGLGWVRVILRGSVLGGVVFGGLVLLLLLRLLERPLCGTSRPVTPFITQGVCRLAFVILGIGFRAKGTPLRGPGAEVANHSSWLDIFALNACNRIYFVSKAEVARWPGIGWLARATGTVFIARDAKQARLQKQMFEDRLTAGHHLVFFPEGTSTDGTLVLPFKSTLFAAFFTEELRDILAIQPVSIRYIAPAGEDGRFYGWWGDMDFGPHLLKLLAAPRQGAVEVTFHPSLKVAEFSSRKALALACENAVRTGFAKASAKQP